MTDAESERFNLVLLERFPQLAETWREVDESRWDPATTGSTIFYNDVLMEALPSVVTAAAGGDPDAERELCRVVAFAEEVAADREGLAIVEHGMMTSFIDAAIDYWEIVAMMGPRTKELFDLQWGPERTPDWLIRRRGRERLGQPEEILMRGDLRTVRVAHRIDRAIRRLLGRDDVLPPTRP